MASPQAITTKHPSPNPKYPFVGDNYLQYGEQPGYIYYPYTDSYHINPKALENQYQAEGLIEKPKEPNLADVVIPGAAVVGGAALAKTLGEKIPGALGLGSDAGAAASTAQTAGAAGAAAAAAPGGLIGSGIGPVADGSAYASSIGQSTPFFTGNGLLSEGAMGFGDYIPGIAGTVGAYDLLKNKKHGRKGATQGAVSGAGIGYTVGGPVGAGIGASIGGLIGYFGNFGDEDRYKTEWKRKKKLYDQGLISAAQLGEEPTRGRSKDELIAEAQRTGGNVAFARSRNEGDLTPQDIQGYSSILEKASQLKMSPEELARLALEARAVREHHGTIDVDWSKVKLPGQPVQQSAGGLI